jgi:hypothetical protein
MLDPVDYILWLIVIAAEFCCLICLVKKKAFTRYFTLALYLATSIAVGAGRFLILAATGFSSNAYVYFYFYSDAVLTICLFFVLMSFYSLVFSEMGVSKLVRSGAMLLLGGTALISHHMVASSGDKMVTRFVFELSQNLYFVGVVLTYVLWGAMAKLRENRTRVLQLVLSMGVYLSAFAASYALCNMYPESGLWRYIMPTLAIWLPVSWTYSFLKVPEDARIATAQVVAPAPR